MSNQVNDKTGLDAVESSYRHDPFVRIGDDGEVRVYVFDEKLKETMIDEERTRTWIQGGRMTGAYARCFDWYERDKN